MQYPSGEKYKVICKYYDRVARQNESDMFTYTTSELSIVPESEEPNYTAQFSGTRAECEKWFMENWESYEL